MTTTENRKSFFSRIAPLFPPKTVWDIELAYTLSKYGHRAQTRKETDENGRPMRYFEHPRRVALILIDEARCARPEMVIAALLHDILEDTKDVTPEMLEHWFSSDVAMLVRMLSKVPKEGYIDRLLAFGDWRTLFIKACDRLDNLRSLSCGSEEFQRKQVAETVRSYYGLLDRLVAIVPPDHAKAAAWLRARIRAEVRNGERRLSRKAAARGRSAPKTRR